MWQAEQAERPFNGFERHRFFLTRQTDDVT